ncbi:hypothetical protein EDC02_5945 [Micromonospora sp. Llam0]|uniref:hypothetical protein n=1 Tax=Micromonospora sp. Llam0 TaxID=2485143 RepID=UPI000FBD4E68|nr:hypothetical protein [Micromonospora sp. Llam0]ROO51081.1 hypothetical protein EDC02_5945 [Micromonospora sp. Llam0]
MSHPQQPQPYSQQPQQQPYYPAPPQGAVYGQPPTAPPAGPPAKPKKKGNPVVGAIALVVIAGLMALCGGIIFTQIGNSADEPIDPVTADRSFDAEVMCQEPIKDRLKAPATAEFPPAEVKKNGAIYSVTGDVDAENGFGAKIRTGYKCTIKDNGDGTWTAIAVTLDE